MRAGARPSLAAVLILGVGAAAGCGQDPVDRHEVEIAALTFGDGVTTVAVGDTVRWVNRDLVPHTVSAAGLLESGELRPGAVFDFVPTRAGDLRYVCAYHPTMVGRLTVEDR